MAYLIASDYLRQIQDVNLQQIITSNVSVRLGAELAAQAEAISYLRQKYNVTQEFTDTNKWGKSSTYKALNRVYLDAVQYAGANTYNIGDYVLNTGIVYVCNTNGTTGTFDVSKFNVVGNQYDIYYAITPVPIFNVYEFYKKDDVVFWNNHTYKCLVQTKTGSHESDLQDHIYSNIPLPNVFPDSTGASTSWQDLGAYNVASNTDINNTTYWSKSDNRDQQMVLYFVDITLYHLHARIAPRNIPQLRIDRYTNAINWLKMCATGDVTPALPVIQPKSGGRIRFGGNVKQINSY